MRCDIAYNGIISTHLLKASTHVNIYECPRFAVRTGPKISVNQWAPGLLGGAIGVKGALSFLFICLCCMQVVHVCTYW